MYVKIWGHVCIHRQHTLVNTHAVTSTPGRLRTHVYVHECKARAQTHRIASTSYVIRGGQLSIGRVRREEFQLVSSGRLKILRMRKREMELHVSVSESELRRRNIEN
jgi:hypothetical protein